jgi:hypothetical protein
MDPWCVLEDQVDELVLFGYIHKHQTLGGLSWSRSSPIVELDAARGWAKTASGRVYKLGRQEWLVDMGAEALCAAALLLPRLGEILNKEQHLLAESWVKACKAARWLGLPPPERTEPAVHAFFEQHAAAYIDLRKKKGLH